MVLIRGPDGFSHDLIISESLGNYEFIVSSLSTAANTGYYQLEAINLQAKEKRMEHDNTSTYEQCVH